MTAPPPLPTDAAALRAVLDDPLRLAELADRLVPVARQAGAAILEVYGTDFTVEAKTDGSPVTLADARAEAIILPVLHALAPGVPVVAEEAHEAGTRHALSADAPFWLVDPLDGTKEFISRTGEFTVNIALVVGGRPVIGVVYAPALDELYLARGRGDAVLVGADGHRTALSARAAPADGITVVASRRHGSNDATGDFLDRLDVPVARFTPRGSSLKFCEIARGDADLYPRFGPTCEWDTAAGHAVLDAAGGRVLRLDGTVLRYGAGTEDRLNPFFVACGPGLVLPLPYGAA